MFALVSFIIVIGVCVVSHEFGHFISARLLGVQVHEFAFGMGPAVYGKEKGNALVYKGISHRRFCAVSWDGRGCGGRS